LQDFDNWYLQIWIQNKALQNHVSTTEPTYGDSLVLHCASVLRITQGNWQHLKMAIFRAGKLGRKKNGHFQSSAVKGRTENVLDSRKRKSSDSLAVAIKVSFQSECESETVLSGRRVVEIGLLSEELADGCNYCRSHLQLSNC